LEFYVLLRWVYFCFFFPQPYMCHTHMQATGRIVTYIIVKSICKATPCRRHCPQEHPLPPSHIIPLTARGACGNLFGLSNAHFLLRVLALHVCMCVCVCEYLLSVLECICVCLQRNQYGGAGVIAAGFTRSCGVSVSPASFPPLLPHPATQKSCAFVLGSYL